MPIPINQGGGKWVDRAAQPYERTSSNVENFQAGIGQMIDEELSISRYIHDQGRRDRNAMIQDMLKEGKIESAVFDQFSQIHPRSGRRTDWDGLAEYANENLGLEDHILSAKELETERNELLDNRRRYREGIFSRSDTSGKFAAFGGSIVGSVADPINIATMFVSAPLLGIKETSRALYTLSVAGRSSLLGAATATAVEPFVHSWKEEIGAEYTWKDSMMNIAASAILDGSISGVAGNIGHRISTSRFDNILTKQRDALITSFRQRGIEDAQASEMANIVIDNPTATIKELDEIAEEVIGSKLETQEKVEVEEAKKIDTEEVENANRVDSNNAEEAAEELEATTPLNEREADAVVTTLRESNEAPDPDMDATEHVERLESTADELDENKSIFSRMMESDLDMDDPEGIDRIFQEEFGDDTEFFLTDPDTGERTSLLDIDDGYADELAEFNDMANCLNGEI